MGKRHTHTLTHTNIQEKKNHKKLIALTKNKNESLKARKR